MLELDRLAVKSGRRDEETGLPALPGGRRRGGWQLADAAVRELAAPFAVLYRQSLSANAGSLLRRAGGKPVRLASKSICCREVLRARIVSGLTGQREFTDLSHRVSATTRMVRFREMEFAVPLDALPSVWRFRWTP